MPRPIEPLELTAAEYRTLRIWEKSGVEDERKAMKAGIILVLAQGLGQVAVAERLAITRQTVALWKKRFEENRLEGLLDVSGRGRKSSLPKSTVNAVVRQLKKKETSGQGPSQRHVAKVLGLSHRTVQRIWNDYTKRLPSKRSGTKSKDVSKKFKSKPKKVPKKKKNGAENEVYSSSRQPEHAVSLSQVAAAAGVSQSTASRALRNDSHHSRETCARVQAVAVQLGYQTNPYVRSLMQSIRSSRTIPIQASLAYVNVRSGEKRWRAYPGNELTLDAMKRQATRHGFVLNEFWPADHGIDEERLLEILRARNINGIIWGGSGFMTKEEWHKYAACFREFSTVSLGAILSEPKCHYVINDQHDSCQLAYTQMWHLGYERIGMVVCPRLDSMHGLRLSTGFFAASRAAHIPELFAYDKPFSEKSIRELSDWLDKYQPDAIFCVNAFLKDALERIKIKIPEDIGFAVMRVDPRFPKWSGILQNDEKIAQAAVDLLANHVYLNEVGIPKSPVGIQIQGEWSSGKTLKRVK